MSTTILRYHHITTDFLRIPKSTILCKGLRRLKTRLSRRRFRQFSRHVVSRISRPHLCPSA